VVAPALSGLLIGALHLRWIFAIVAVAYLLAAVAALRMSAIPGVAGAPRPGFGSVVGGLRYLRGRQVLQGVFLIDINAMVFGPPRALFPAMAISVFHGGASTLGYLYAAPAAGALVGALSPFRHYHRHPQPSDGR
jgi:Transmembrane secretion effector